MKTTICEVCEKGPVHGVTVFRVNPKGVAGIWRCRAHLTSAQAERQDPETIQLVNIIDPPDAAMKETTT
jgi:hypothetical protein